MSEEKLPEYVKESIDKFDAMSRGASVLATDACETDAAAAKLGLLQALSRYANERVAEALEQAAKACEQQAWMSDFAFGHDGSEKMMADKIRSLIPSEARKA